MSQTLSTQIVVLTPELAARYLEANTSNRAISGYRLNQLTEQILAGEWALNGEAIKVAEDGTLLDGQHRCAAVVKANKPIETLVITGLPNITQETMDTGKSRTLADILSIREIPNAVSVASVVTGVLAAERYGFSKAFVRSNTTVITNGAALHRLENDPFILGIPSRISAAVTKSDLTMKVLGTLYYFFYQIDAEDAEFFIDRLEDGADLPEGSPILVLRKAAKALKEAKGARNARYLGAVVIKAWNAYRDGRNVRVLTYRIGGAKPEPFPEPH